MNTAQWSIAAVAFGMLLTSVGCLGGCAYSGNNDISASIGVSDDHKLIASIRGTVDTTVEADPWSAVEWGVDSVNAAIGIIIPGWQGLPGLAPLLTPTPTGGDG